MFTIGLAPAGAAAVLQAPGEPLDEVVQFALTLRRPHPALRRITQGSPLQRMTQAALASGAMNALAGNFLRWCQPGIARS